MSARDAARGARVQRYEVLPGWLEIPVVAWAVGVMIWMVVSTVLSWPFSLLPVIGGAMVGVIGVGVAVVFGVAGLVGERARAHATVFQLFFEVVPFLLVIPRGALYLLDAALVWMRHRR